MQSLFIRTTNANAQADLSFSLRNAHVQLILHIQTGRLLSVGALNSVQCITKTRLFKYIDNFTSKKLKISDEKL